MGTYTINPAEMPIHVNIPFAGVTCVLATNSSSVVDSITQLHPLAEIPSKRSFALHALVDPSIRTNNSAIPHFRGHNHFVFAMFSDQEIFTFDLHRNLGFGAVSCETAANPQFWNRILLPIAVGVLGIVNRVVPVHAACLDRKGRGLMIAGRSGAGKSTLAVALARSGFSIVSDDWTYLVRDGEVLWAYGLRAPVKLLADATEHFSELAPLQPERSLNGELAYEVNPREVFSVATRSKSKPWRILFLERVEEPGCTFIAGDRAEAKEFFESNVERLPVTFARFVAERSRIIDEFTALDRWLLKTGDSPVETAAAISRFCEN